MMKRYQLISTLLAFPLIGIPDLTFLASEPNYELPLVHKIGLPLLLLAIAFIAFSNRGNRDNDASIAA